MARKTSKFMIGLFVTLGVLIGMVAVVWLGASKYFEKGKLYSVYFDESVQGLQMDSAVKYLGVEVGSVEKIRIAPDNNLIEVVIKINLRRDLARDAVAQLRSAGITGIVFIELDRRDPVKPDRSPKLNFASEYPIISSQPSQLKQLFSGIEEVVDNLKRVDTQGISDEIKMTIKSIGNLVSGEKMDHIMTGVDSAVSNVKEITGKVNNVVTEKRLEDMLVEAKNSLLKVQNLVEDVQGKLNSLNLHKTGVNLENATARIDKILASGQVEAILGETRGAIANANSAIVKIKSEIDSMRLSETAEKANALLEGIDRKSDVLARNLIVTLESLRRALDSLQVLMERVKANPSDLIFSEPTPPPTIK